MFINNHSFETNLGCVNNIRYLFFTNLYCDNSIIKKLTDVISKHIECLSIEYSYTRYTFTIKIKKTAMRRIYGFKQDPNFYYKKIPDIFTEFIKTNEDSVLSALSKSYENPHEILSYLYNNPNIMSNLCIVSCIADNIVCIKL